MDILINNMDENMSYEKSCGAVVYTTSNKGIQYLLLKSIGLDSYWGFPKGHMEYSETEEETALEDYRWCNYEEAKSLLTYESGRRIISETNKFLCERN